MFGPSLLEVIALSHGFAIEALEVSNVQFDAAGNQYDPQLRQGKLSRHHSDDTHHRKAQLDFFDAAPCGRGHYHKNFCWEK